MTDFTNNQEIDIEDPLSPEGDDYESSKFIYSIASYGADYTVDGFVKRLVSGDIFVPPFQRKYVWNQHEASRFIESLLLGLPVPGIFLAKDQETQKLMVLDGQQRLQTLRFFYDGIFSDSKKQFLLKGIDERFEGKTYKTLSDEERRRLDDTVIHATVVKQEQPTSDQSSIFHIFERINTGGQQLTSQEIRACIYYGDFSSLLRELNGDDGWRKIYGSESKKMRDQELILRFLAMFFDLERYKRPMKEFLNEFMSDNRHLSKIPKEQLQAAFLNTVKTAIAGFGDKPFRLRVALNTAVFDSMMYGLAKRLMKGPINNISELKSIYSSLITKPEYLACCEKSTADEKSVSERMRLATVAFDAAT